MPTPIAEDLLLLLLDDVKGTTPGLWLDVRVPLGTAVLAELALDGIVELEPDPPGGSGSQRRACSSGTTTPCSGSSRARAGRRARARTRPRSGAVWRRSSVAAVITTAVVTTVVVG